MSGCRIGRVKLKSGATVIPLRADERDDHQAAIRRHAGMVADGFKPGAMRGFVVIGFDREGRYDVGFRLDDDCMIGKTLLPSWVAEVIRKTLVQDGEWT